MKTTDQILWLKVMQGNRKAFTALFDTWWEPLFQYGYKTTGSTVAAEEMVQELFIHIWCKREQLPEVQSVRAYLFTALKNRVLNYFNARKMTVVEIEAAVSLHGTASASVIVDRKETEQQLHEAAAVLPDKMKQVYEMHFIHGISVAEIAQATGNSAQTIRNQLNIARKKTIVNLILSVLP